MLASVCTFRLFSLVELVECWNPRLDSFMTSLHMRDDALQLRRWNFALTVVDFRRCVYYGFLAVRYAAAS